MKSLKELLQVKAKLSSTRSNRDINKNPIDSVLEDYQELLHPEFRAWYALAIKRLGRHQFMQVAAVARQEGRHPQRYFNWLLKRKLHP